MSTEWIYTVTAVLCAGLLAFSATPAVRVLAFKVGAVDRVKDGRRMHRGPISRMGGLAMFFAFFVTTLVFCELTPDLIAVWVGGAVLVVLGIFDDIFSLKAWVKALVQIAVSFIPILLGVRISFLNWGGIPTPLGGWSIPVTVLWIVTLTNAVNLIDGLDGLACGVSMIGSVSIALITLLNGNSYYALLAALLAGSCLGFLPFNSNPAKIIMGDTGSLFLGYTLSVLSIGGVFKFHAVLSFLIPIAIFGLPLFDTCFAFFRRILHGKSPFVADRGHLHHRLVDMGFGHRQSVRILYCISGLLGIAAILLTEESHFPALILITVAIGLYVSLYCIMKNKNLRRLTGLENIDPHPEDVLSEVPASDAGQETPDALPHDRPEGLAADNPTENSADAEPAKSSADTRPADPSNDAKSADSAADTGKPPKNGRQTP